MKDDKQPLVTEATSDLISLSDIVPEPQLEDLVEPLLAEKPEIVCRVPEADIDESPVKPEKEKPRQSIPVREDDDDIDEEDDDDDSSEVCSSPKDYEASEDLETVYDLEGEGTFRGTQPGEEAPALPWKGRVETAKEFFATELLYRHDLLEKEQKDAVAGRYRIELRGYRGGVWTMDIAQDIRVVNKREHADVVLAMPQHDFVALVNGELNPQLAILSKRVRISGDVRRALAVQSILAPMRD